MRRAAFRRYLLALAGALTAGLVLVTGLNALINPFNLYEGIRIGGFNDYKYELGRYSRLSKAAEVRRIEPDCLILGSSRAQLGLDPAQPAWAGCRAYNLAHNGGTLYEAMRYLQHADAAHRPKQVVLALDFLMFNVYRPLRQPGFEEARLLTHADGTPNRGWRRAYAYDVFSSLASWDTLVASWNTVFPPYTRRARGPEDGFWEYTRLDMSYFRRHGQREIFRRNEEGFLTENWFPAPRHQFRTRDAALGLDSYDFLRTILRLAHRDGIALSLLISPAHARQSEARAAAGLWNDWEDWKRELVRVNDEEARRAGHAPFPLWDFSGYSRYTTEAVPPDGDREHFMRWYWESSHYRKELGDRVLAVVLGEPAGRADLAAGFGVRLDARSLDAQLAAVRAGRERWRKMHPQDAAEIAAIAQRTAAWRRP